MPFCRVRFGMGIVAGGPRRYVAGMLRSTAARMLAAYFIGLMIGGVPLVVEAGPETLPLANDYVLRVWETDDGLPQNIVTGLAQTPDGYLWLATQGGVVRFDGVRFTPYFKGTTPGLDSSYARAVTADRAGALWIGLERGGVARMQGGRFATVLPAAPPTAQTRWASSFAEDAEGAVWIGMAPDQAVYRWRAGQLTRLTAEDGVGAGDDTFVHADSEGRIWFATKMTCGVFDGTRFVPIDPEGGDRVHLTPARAGGMWATRGQKLLHYSAEGTRREMADLAWLGGAVEINTLYEDRAGDLWLGTRGAGLLRFRAGSFSRVPTSHQAVHAIFEDRDGTLWAGTSGGLNRLRPQHFFLRGAEQGLAKEGVVSLCEDSDGVLWLAVRDSEAVRSVDATHQSFAVPEGGMGGVATTLCPDPSGGIWIGYDGGSLQRWYTGGLTKIGGPQRTAALLSDREGNLWMASMREGLLRLRDGSVHPESTTGGLMLVRALAEDTTGSVWAGTEDGLVFRRENGRFMPVELPGARGGESIRFIVPDGANVWIGARDGGLFRWRAGQVDRLPGDAGLPVHDLRALIIEPDGDFWLAMAGSLFCTTRQNVEDVMSGRVRELRGTGYGRDDGVPKLGFAFGRRNAVTRTRDGRLWFATDRGPLEVNPEPLPEKAPPAPVLIEEVRVNGVVVAPGTGASLVLAAKPGPVEIHYTAPQPGAPERLRFRYRLAGLEEEWTPGQTTRLATYARLPPGDYRFEVAATAGDGSEAPTSVAVLPFRIRAAWWEMTAFRVIFATLTAVGIAALVRMLVLRRVRRRILLLEQQHALEKERARIARDMHDDLGASLTRIALMSELAAGEPEMRGAAEQLGAIAQAARSVSGTLDQIVWTVNPRNDTLERLVGYLGEFADEYLAPTGLTLRLELPIDVPALPVVSEVRHAVLLAIKETLNNVVKHAQAREVSLRVVIAAAALQIVIKDNGQGFDPSEVGAFSNGLANLRQRLGTLGGGTQIESRPGSGTTVTLHVPLAHR
jgi:signal transduction histidine kinase/ligand-binding sensor domain-containing protein